MTNTLSLPVKFSRLVLPLLFLSASPPVLGGLIYYDIDCMVNRDMSNFAELRVCYEFDRDDTATAPPDRCNSDGGDAGGGGAGNGPPA